ncbi:MAG: MFS transporter [Myxococcota bacterium]
MLIALLPGPLGFTLQMPTLQTLITRRVPSTEMGQALGISASFAGAGMVVGPILGGLLFDHLGPSAPFTVSAALSMVLLGAFWARESRAS